MTAAIDVDGALARADRRWAGRHGDDPAPPEYLRHLANAVRPLRGATAAEHADAEGLRVDNARLADYMQAEVDKSKRLGAELVKAKSLLNRHGELLKEQQAETDRLRAELADAERDRDAARQALAEQAAARVEPHRHQYPWTDPAGQPEPCACGQDYPRTVPPPAVADAEPESDPWGAVLGQVRAELAGWPT